MEDIKKIFEAANVDVAVLGNVAACAWWEDNKANHAGKKPQHVEEYRKLCSNDADRKAEAVKLLPAFESKKLTPNAAANYIANQGGKIGQQTLERISGFKPVAGRSERTTTTAKAVAPVVNKTAVERPVSVQDLPKAERYFFEALMSLAGEQLISQANQRVIERILADEHAEIERRAKASLSTLASWQAALKAPEQPVEASGNEAMPEDTKGKKEGVAVFLGRLAEDMAKGEQMLKAEDEKRLLIIKESGNSDYSEKAHRFWNTSLIQRLNNRA